jgi:hypothetical protein
MKGWLTGFLESGPAKRFDLTHMPAEGAPLRHTKDLAKSPEGTSQARGEELAAARAP